LLVFGVHTDSQHIAVQLSILDLSTKPIGLQSSE
jgi:hypothetical protein